MIPGSGRSTGEGNGYLLQCSDLENCETIPWGWSQTQLSNFYFQFHAINWFDNLLEQLTKPRKILMFTGLLKDTTARWKRCTGQRIVYGVCMGLPYPLWVHHCSSTLVCSPSQFIKFPCLGAFIELNL